MPGPLENTNPQNNSVQTGFVSQKTNLKDSYRNSNLDLEDSGPISVGRYNHQQVWSPQNKYEDYVNQSGFENSNLEEKSFDGTYKSRGYSGDFDIENNDPRKETYTTKIGKDVVSVETHQWTPKNAYADSFSGIDENRLKDLYK